MGTTSQYYLHGVLLGGATWVPVLSDATPAANVDFLTEWAGAAVTPSFTGAQQAIPDVTFTTSEIKTILDACTDGDGVSIKGYSSTQIDLCYRLATNFGSREACGL